METTQQVLDGVRAITDDEVKHFQTNGWVKLEGLLDLSIVEKLLERAKAKMGAEEPQTRSTDRPDELRPNDFKWYERWDGCSHQDSWIRNFTHATPIATVASRLMGGSPVRFYYDHVFVKIPVAVAGTETPWHQDLPHHPLDRQGALTMWMPLVDCPPEKGTMRFLNGSHRTGLLGRYLNRGDGVNLLDEHPEMADRFELSPPLHLKPGDATVHDLGVIHYAPPNTTDTPRWVYTLQWLPPHARYTGAPNHRTDGHGLEIDRPLDHPRFPIIPTP
ncbi:phytanoyl-CoA dioxygenase family protein [Micromonospora cathayae]|uniref:Phytanoyl-CoA dioxygenase family protein n=1 Tax=Micromonospora cathayae TaxID=3028804 RepID=A0ABY7ZSA1_9ACTN|nr:phytanoyl-CoA dioxygenase family protein [Micromonospora sp. HUAS 3]WDZ85840.1 phytanoyl-CoA dioxygenase family protein [Micromonospora sp. HUAS 3]